MSHIVVPNRLPNFNSLELLEKLENFLKNKNLPPTGIKQGTLPDPEWVIRLLKFLDPDDTC